MKTTIDRAGRLVIPKKVRPVLARVRLQRRGRLLVAVPEKKQSKLLSETVERTRASLLEDRASKK